MQKDEKKNITARGKKQNSTYKVLRCCGAHAMNLIGLRFALRKLYVDLWKS